MIRRVRADGGDLRSCRTEPVDSVTVGDGSLDGIECSYGDDSLNEGNMTAERR